MKRNMMLILLLLISWSGLKAQGIGGYADQQKRLQERAMLVLGTWGLANIVSGGIGMATTEGDSYAFHQMNMGWGLINAGIAAIGYYGARKLDFNDSDFFRLYNHNINFSKTLVFNAGLDIGYIGFGLYLRERSKNVTSNPERIRGFGNSIMVQGAFLFLFDMSAFYFNGQLEGVLKDHIIRLSPTSNGLGMVLEF